MITQSGKLEQFDTKDLSGVMEMFYILTEVWDSFVKTHLIVHLRPISLLLT